ncbi:hypothetical protein T440DRAFT_470166 [Plenodomus tracheiphilus IPT5]|uniref:Uncharacterized protein n=1 Tax=Plenodomus tracheiphilus IPT5 TaxID=1408161 RepID=A0A6A7AZT5_9PLEO|nr:hypothetical protein T440DRAFT_470166 [Plenodomus tracheiphilus IPT5]
MRFSTLATTALSATLTSARIIGISTPSTLSPNTSFPLTLITEGYIQTVADIAIAYGFQLPSERYPLGFPGSLGGFAKSAYLGPQNSNTVGNVTVNATVPAELASQTYQGKDVVLTAGIYSIYGASGDVGVYGWNVTVRIGEATGGENVSSVEQAWKKNTVTPVVV